jgi:non-specific serine/threonine protein kinase
LLNEHERILFRRLSVFAGSWTLEATEAVCAGDGIVADEVLECLAGLVNKSLVDLDEQGAGSRYRLLETVRQYGHEQLVAAGEAGRLRDRHLDWYLALAVRAAPVLWMRQPAVPALDSHAQAVWLERLEAEVENLRAALAWAATDPARREKGVHLVESMGIWWYLRGHVSEGRRWLEDLLAGSDGPAAGPRARGLNVLGALAWSQGDHQQALQLQETAYTLFRQEGNQQRAAYALSDWGLLALCLGDRAHAAILLEEALGMFRELGHRHGEGWALSHLGTIQHLEGRLARATALYEASLALLTAVADAFGVGNQLANLANVARDLGDYERAGQLHRESLEVRRDLKDQPGFAECFEGLAVVAACLGQPERAALLFGAAEQLREAIHRPVDLADRTAHERTVPLVREALGEDAFAAAWARGRALPLEKAIARALEGVPATGPAEDKAGAADIAAPA